MNIQKKQSNFHGLCKSQLIIILSVLVFLFSMSAFAQNIQITGDVKDSKNNTLPGVNVLVKGTSIGTTTDFDGKYSINVPNESSELEFSSLGFVTNVQRVGQLTIINMILADNSQELEEVVVVGYGVQRKSDITGAIGRITSEEILENPSFNALESMRGKVSGVNVFTNSGSPSGSNRVVIRGVGTINSSSNPLYVVDGVAMQDFQYLNPNDIESMEVLKDASSTAIYGARGANGVILVTTKRGNKSDKITVGYDTYYSFGQLRKEMDVLDSDQLLQVMKTGFENAPKYNDYQPGTAPVLTTNDPRLFDANGKPLYNTNWQKEATRTAISQNHQISIQQGGEKSSVGAFLNYTDSQGIMLNSYMKRINAKFAYDVKPKEWFDFGINMLVNRTTENAVEEDGGGQSPRRTMIEMPSFFPVKYPDGSWSNSIGTTDNFGFEAMANPVHVLETQERLRNRTQIFGNAALTFHIAQGLDLKTQFGVDNQYRNYKDYWPTDLVNISAPNGFAQITNEQNMYWQQETFLTFKKDIGENHRINSVLGLSWQENSFETNNSATRGFSDNFFKYNNMGAAINPDPPTSLSESWAMNSYFVRTGYTYKDRYLSTFTARMDGSSRFGAQNKYAFFPSLGLGWVASKEDFFINNLQFINQLKFRTSYGLTGNSEIGTYRSLATIASGTALINGERAPSSYSNRLPNSDLKWEKTSQFDIGFDLSMFQNRVSLEFDYYYKSTTDLLLDRPVPHSTGFTSILDNIGEVSNRGLDILVSTVNIENDDFSWNTSLNLNFNKNRIEKLGTNNEDIEPGPFWVSGSQTILRVGESLGSFYGYTRLGTWGTDEAAEAALVNQRPGEAKRSTTKSILGSGLPDWTGSFINRLRYKNFDFILDFQFVKGGEILQQFFHSTQDRTGYGNGLVETLTDAWTEQNQNTMIQQIRNGPISGQSSEMDSQWVSDGSYLRLNSISLGYNFTDAFLEKSGLSRLRVYSTLNNAWVLNAKSFRGFDPEGSSQGGNQWGQNMFFFQYPRPTTLTLGLNVSF